MTLQQDIRFCTAPDGVRKPSGSIQDPVATTAALM